MFELVEVDADDCYELLETAEKTAGGVQLDKAAVIVAGGRGVKNEADLELLRQLASALGGQLAGSRPLVESGLLPHERQLGQSGCTVKAAPIFGISQYGIAANFRDVVPAITEEIQKRKGANSK